MADAVEHSALTGSDLHEPKGADNANANDRITADGAGGSSWVDHPIGEVFYVETVVAFSDVDAAGEKVILTVATGRQYKVREIFLTGAGTNFDAGGDRLLDITDNTSIWTAIPVATLKALAVARWGDTGTPFPATAVHMNTASAASTDIVAKHSGGATDFTAGSLTLIVVFERVV